MNVVLLGSGNVAMHLGRALVGAGHRILQVFSPTKHHAESLANLLGAEGINHLTDVDIHADVYIIAVKDDAIEEVIADLPSPLKGFIVHTAGSVDMAALAPYTTRYGVLYPVQTFSKVKTVDFSSIPLAIEASDEATYHNLEHLSNSLSNRVFPCDSKQRLSLHVAAVFACNFTNHLYAIAADILGEHRLDFDLIRPLILETAEKATEHLPKDVQTGPAVRGDGSTMEKHLGLLKEHPDLQGLYVQMSEWIKVNR